MLVAKELVIEPAPSWARLQEAKNSEWFVNDLEEQIKEHHRLFLEELMRYERQQHLGAAPYERASGRTLSGQRLLPALAVESTWADGTGGAAESVRLIPNSVVASLSAALSGRG
jgi:hypothetical protein